MDFVSRVLDLVHLLNHMVEVGVNTVLLLCLDIHETKQGGNGYVLKNKLIYIFFYLLL